MGDEVVNCYDEDSDSCGGRVANNNLRRQSARRSQFVPTTYPKPRNIRIIGYICERTVLGAIVVARHDRRLREDFLPINACLAMHLYGWFRLKNQVFAVSSCG
jgi:hypothetical protein